jgi:molecular chaperone IbpA
MDYYFSLNRRAQMKIKDVFGKHPMGDSLFKDFDRFYVGFDDHVAKMAQVHKEFVKNIPGYPPYNIRKVDENKYQIEMAVAGFGKQDIDIELADSKLIIKGSAQSDTDDTDYMFKGIGTRAFTRTFAIDDQVEVQSAELVNGMLKVFLEKLVPEEKKPKKVKIKDHDYGTTL